ncbi:MAG: transglycosylase SLT domain-containing protein [Hahellaceae bacterium]|nr:transglycosylase SLT domain-containing protein [Hahellaceae bacterium]MCP5212283.1 transglycosylase SLT domain-containing protein [Hahellaceae bacterium]
MLSRRQFAGFLATGALAALPVVSQAKPLQFLLEKTQPTSMSAQSRLKLSKAVLDLLESHYKGMTLQFWQQPFEQIDFEKRITNIVYWVDLAIVEHASLFSVDPVWVMSQIMAESLFCELAISPALAAGICQFMPSTATKAYQMTVAGSLPAHKQPPYLATDLAGSLDNYRDLVGQRNAYRKATSAHAHFDLSAALELLAQGKLEQEKAREQIERQRQLNIYRDRISQASDNYVTYIETNITELGKRDIFTYQDFFTGFDERFTYKKPIFAMVHMLANALRVRNGNILAAAAAYNAGLGRTWTNEAIYTQYGLLPSFEETARYISRIVVNYEEISKRFYG